MSSELGAWYPHAVKRSLSLLLCLGFCACAGSKQTPATASPKASEASSPAPQAQANAQRVAKDDLPESRFELLDAGQAPKTLLAMAPTVGTQVKARTASQAVSSVYVGGQLVSKAPSPTAITSIQAQVIASSPQEIKVDWTSEHTVEAVEGGNAKEYERLKAKRDAQGTSHGVLTFNARGQRTGSSFDRGDKELIAWDANIVMAWPKDPVGPGARWKTVLENRIDGIDCVVTTHVTLLSIQEGQAFLEIDSVTKGKPGKLELPEIPKNVDLELISMDVHLKGQLVRNIAEFHQEHGELKGSRELVMKLRALGQEQEMRSQAELRSVISYDRS